METFKYRALAMGNRVVEGKKRVPSETDLVRELRASGYVVLSVQKVKGSHTYSRRFRGLSKKALMAITQELATLLDGGIPLDRSLKILANAQNDTVFKGILENVLSSVKSGKPLAESLSAYPQLFSEVYVNMVKAGEEGGALPQVLYRLFSFQEKMEKIRAEIFSATIYPILLTFTGMVSVSILVIYVIPKFSQIFEGMGIPMPLSTKVLLAVSHFMVSYGWIGFLIVALSFLIYTRFFYTKFASIRIDKRKLKIPLIGDIIWKIEISRFARTIGTLLSNGVPLLKSLEMGRAVLSNAYLVSVLDEVRLNVKQGEGLSVPLAKRGFLPDMTVHLLVAGEETGELGSMLVKIADLLDSEVEEKTKRLLRLLEPALILVMGLIVGAIVASMLLAIFSINQANF